MGALSKLIGMSCFWGKASLKGFSCHTIFLQPVVSPNRLIVDRCIVLVLCWCVLETFFSCLWFSVLLNVSMHRLLKRNRAQSSWFDLLFLLGEWEGFIYNLALSVAAWVSMDIGAMLPSIVKVDLYEPTANLCFHLQNKFVLQGRGLKIWPGIAIKASKMEKDILLGLVYPFWES